MKNLNEQIHSVKRELTLRHAVYPRRVRDGKMTQDDAAHEMECMQAILETLEKLAHRERTQPYLFQ